MGRCKGTPPGQGKGFHKQHTLQGSADLARPALQHLAQVQIARPHQVVGSIPQHAVHLCRPQQRVWRERGLRGQRTPASRRAPVQHRECFVVAWQVLISPNPWLLCHVPTSTWSVRGVDPS